MTLPYTDGSAQSHPGNLLLPNLLNGYSIRPDWQVAGVDYAVGVPSGTVLKDPSTIAMAGVSVNAGSHTITITASNVTLSGYDFGLAGGWGISIQSGVTNTTIENSHFLVGSNNQVPINAGGGVGNLTVAYNSMDGGSSQSTAVWAMVNYNGSGTFTALYNSFVNVPSDAIDFSSGSMTTVVKYNVFENLGTAPGSHADSIQYVGVTSNNSVFAFNTVFSPNPSGDQGIQIAAQNGSTLNNTTVDNNVVVAKAGPSLEMSYSIAIQQLSGSTINGVIVKNNYIDSAGAWGPFYPPTGSNLSFSGNMELSSGTPIASPGGTMPSDVTQVTASPGSGTSAVGATIMLTIAVDSVQFVIGVPTLMLNDGGTAFYTGGSGTNSLSFTYTVSSADRAVTALAVIGVAFPSGASIRDAYGNATNLAGADVTFSGLAINPGSGTSPTALGDSAATTENQAVTIAVLSVDSYPGGSLNPASVTIRIAAAHGTTVVNTTTGAITYTPATGFTGVDTFTYTVAGINGGVSAPATVSVNVTAPAVPITVADSASTPENQAVAIAVLSVDTDPGGTINAGSVKIGTAAGHGTTAVNTTTGVVTYTPATGFTGTDTFTYTVAGSNGSVSLPATVVVNVVPPAPPATVADSASTPENQAVTISVLSVDSDPGGSINPATVIIGTAAAHGTTAVNTSTGAVTYTPAAGFTGTDTFTYTVANTSGSVSAPAAVTINVTAPSSGYADGASGAPTGTSQLPTILSTYKAPPPWQVAGVNYAVGVPSGTSLKDPSTIAMAGVSVNTANHTVTISGNNVTLSGYNFGLANGWSVIVNGANDTIRNSKFVVGSNQGSNGTVVNATSSSSNFSLISNEIDGANIAVTAQQGTTVSIASSGSVTLQYNYLHNSGGDMIDFNRSSSPEVDIVQYNLFSNIGVNTAHADTLQWYNTQIAAGSDIGFNTVYQNVNQPGAGNGALVPLSEGPQSTMDGLTVNNDTIIQTANVTNGNFSTGFYADLGGVASNIVIHDLYIDPTGPLGWTGSPWFPTAYYGSNLATPTVMSNVINMVTGAQVLVPSSTSKTSQGYYTYTSGSANSPVLGDVYSVTTSPATGRVTVGQTIAFTLNLDESFTVTGTPALTLNDGGKATYASGSGTRSLVFTYTVGSTDHAVTALAIIGVTLPAGASIRDAYGNAANLATADVTLNGLSVNPPPAPPTAAADAASTPQDQLVTIAVLANSTDTAGTIDPSSVVVSTSAAHGTTTVNTATGVVSYTPATGFYGTDTFAYTVADTLGDVSNPATVTVTVVPTQVTLTSSGNTITGGASLLTVVDNAGGNTIAGGIGGLTATVWGANDIISTAIGSANVLLLHGSDTINSYGQDNIDGGTGNQVINVYGTAYIGGSTTANTLSLHGATHYKSNGGLDVINVAAGSQDWITAGQHTSVTETGGAVYEHIALPPSAQGATKGSWIGAIGGEASIAVDATAGLDITSAAGQSTTINVSNGPASIYSNGADNIHLGGQATVEVTLTGANTTIWAANVLIAVVKNDTVAGDVVAIHGGGGALTYTQGSGTLNFIGGAGTANLNGANGALHVTGGSGALTIQGGTQGMTFMAGSGTANVTMASGLSSAGVATPGYGGNGEVTFGSGTTTVQVAGGLSGAAIFDFIAGRGAGTDLINGFRTAIDHLALHSGVSVASETVLAAGVDVVLSDNTHLQLAGLTSTAGLFH